LVRQHFETLGKVVALHSGAIVKTIGDAVMATLMAPLEAVRAAVDMLEEIERFNAGVSTPLVLKIGLHKGHSIVVTLNDRLDYFGQTVNIASRVRALANAGETCMTGEVYDYPGVREALDGGGVLTEPATLRGVSETVSVYRVAGSRPSAVT
jgi:class 3 adenylate cyclase